MKAQLFALAALVLYAGCGTARAEDYKLPAGDVFDESVENGYVFSKVGTDNVFTSIIVATGKSEACSLVRTSDNVEFDHRADPVVNDPLPLVGPVTDVGKPVTSRCAFTIFGGRALTRGWQLVDLVFNHDGARDLTGAPGRCRISGRVLLLVSSFGTHPTFAFESQIDVAGPHPGCVFVPITITQFTLRGPDNRDWREAFRPGAD